MSEWPVVRLGDVVDLATGFPFASEGYTDDAASPRLLRGDNVGQGTLRWDGAKRWPSEAAGDLDAYRLRDGDVILAMDRPWIEAGLKYASVRESDLPALLVQRVARLRGAASLATPFLKYVIGSRAFTQYVTAVQTGTAVPHISGRQIQNFEFRLPSLPEQGRISEILGALDDKIELNRRMSETLQMTARAMFKSWFVAEAGTEADGWRSCTIGDLAEIVGGSTPSTTEPRFWNGSHHWATPKDLAGLKTPVLLRTERMLTDAGIGQISSGLLPAGTVLMSSRAPIGYLAITEVPVAINQGFIAMKPRPGVSGLFLLLWAASSQDQILSRANGSTFLEISKSSFRPIPVVTPPAPIFAAFDDVVRPTYSRIVANERETRTLTSIRDTLLPRLISGELRLKDADQIVEAVSA